MGIIAAGQITVVDLSDAPVLNAFITASRPTTQTYSKDSRSYNPSYASTPQVLTLNVTKSGSTTSIIDSISGLHWFVVDGSVKTEITSKVNTSNEYISGNNNENLTTKLNIDTNKGYRRYEATGVWRDPSTDLDVQFSANINLLLTQNGATGPQGPQGDDGPQGPQGETGNGIANTVVTYGLSMSDTTEPATWSSERPALVKGMYLWTRTVIIYTNGESTTSYQINYIPKDGDATGEIDKTKQELLEKLETVRDDSLAAVEEAKQQLVTVRDESLAAAEEAKQQVGAVADDLSKAKTDFQNAVNTVDTKATNVQNDLSKAKQDLASQAQKLQEQANAQSELTNRVSSVEETANGTKTTVSELSKTVDQNSKNITSVTARTKVVEDDLSGTKTTLSQVKTTADSTSQKTATLETGLNGLSAKFENLNVGDTNLIKQSTAQKGWRLAMGADPWEDQKHSLTDWIKIEPNTTYTLTTYEDVPEENMYYSLAWYSTNNNDYSGWISRPTGAATAADLKGGRQYTSPANAKYAKVSYPTKYAKVKLERGNISTDYTQNGVDLEQKVAEYKQTADQNYASLSSTVQNLDGTVQHNKTVAEQTAEGFKTRIESLETYKSGESTRANQYFELAKTETARQLSVERTAIAKDYVAKSTYTSDVTGIRNELSATTITANTTKQNLASYQASNDKVVANLQSNIQTANGDISSLKTKVEAVPGQITSAVSSVESKIPNVDNKNLLITSTATKNTAIFGSEVYPTPSSTTENLATIKEAIKVSPGEKYTFTKISKPGDNYWRVSYLGSKFELISRFPDSSNKFTITIPNNVLYMWISFPMNSDAKVEKGSTATGYSPAPEDAINQISSLSSQVKQTADGITLLATKTELNSAKNELQSGINTATNKANSNAQTISTHTTQISALNTGLQAKVSQSDFNTLSGRVTTAENNIVAKANELSSKITSVEGKIPTSVGVRNLLTKTNQGKTNWWWSVSSGGTTAEDYNVDGVNAVKLTRTSNSSFTWHYIQYDGLLRKLIKPNTKYTLSFDVKPSVNVTFWAALKRGDSGASLTNGAEMNIATANQWTKVSCVLTTKTTLPDDLSQVVYLSGMPVGTGNWLIIKNIKLEEGVVSSDWQPAPEDNIEEISTLSSELKQTQNGITLLATKTELNSAKSELQSGINTATNKANNAQTTANNNAQTIRTHTTQISALNTGLSAKVSQSDFNTLSGRVTTAENNIIAKANELSSKITSVEGKIPTEIGANNLIIKSTAKIGFRLGLDSGLFSDSAHSLSDWIKIEPNTTYTLTTYENVNEGSMYYSLAWYSTNSADHSGWIDRPTGAASAANLKGGKQYRAPANAKYAKVSYPTKYAKVKFERGKISSDYSPAPEDTINQISSLSSEFKQTTDSIKASVTSLDKSTVKSSSLTINADGIVMKAGKSTTDVANAIGSYFAVNQNAINLFADKIKVKGNMIVSGSISSDKISSNGITANVIKGGTLQSTNGSTNFELNTGKLFYNNNNTGVFRVQNNASTMGLKFSNTSITVSGTSRILSRAILGGDRRETTLDDGKWDKGGFSGIVIETIKGVEPRANEHADATRVISDNIYFTHTYSADSPTGASAHGWKMETYAPDSSYSGNIVLKPYGLNYRQSDIIVGDLRMDNGDGSGYWLRATINTLKACFGHILNGGTSSQALNAIRSELNKISGT